MKQILPTIFGLALAFSLVSGQPGIPNPAAALWDDPTFVKSFTASYGVLSTFEPEISDAEKAVLRELLPSIRNNPRAAISSLETKVSADSSAALDFVLANLYFQQNRLAEAARSYRNATRKYPNFRRAHKNLGLVLVQNGDFAAAIPAISQGLALGDVDGRSYGLLGYSYLTAGLYYPAEAAYRQAILMQPTARDWKLGLARCLIETSDFDGSITLFDTLLKEEPNNVDFWLLQANAFIGKGAALSAAENIEVVRRMGGANLPTLTMLGDIYLNNSLPRLALGAYLEALEVSGSEAMQPLLRAAELFTSRGDYDQSTALIERVRAKMGAALSDAVDLRLLTLEAKIARANGAEDEAFALLQKIVERDALNGEALIELGDYYARKGDLDRAVNRYEQAQLISRYERPALIAHAQTLIRRTQYKEALALLNRALELESDKHLLEYVERIKRALR
ncbi:MAG: tetratricopeptide repeat protein [Opitutales bacterium]